MSPTSAAIPLFSETGNEPDRHFWQMADVMPHIVWTATSEGANDFFNQQWHTYTGMVRDPSVCCGWEPIIHPDDFEYSRNSWLMAVREGKSYEIEHRLLRASDKTYRWHVARACPLKDNTGKVIKWVGTAIDIEDQKRAQEVLRQAVKEVESKVKKQTDDLRVANLELIQAIGERRKAMSLLEEDTHRLSDIISTQALLATAQLDLSAFMNLAVEKIARLTPATGAVVELVQGDEIVYCAASGHLAPFIGTRLKINSSLSGSCMASRKVTYCDDTATDPRVDKKACEELSVSSMVVAPLFHENISVGVIKIASDRPCAFSERDGQTLELLAGILGSGIAQQTNFERNEKLLSERSNALSALQAEVEQRIRSEELLRQSEQRIRQIIDSAHDAFISMDANGKILDWNLQAEVIFGWTKEEAIGRDLTELIIPEEKRAAHKAGVARFAITGRSERIRNRVEVVALHKDGRSVPIEVSVSAVRQGNSYTANAFARDISERQEAERKLNQLARYDSLTGLANRQHFEERLDEAIARCRRMDRGCGLLFLDIDHFKSINDTHGHIGGDEALKRFAALIKRNVRSTDTVARLAGDEFVIILEGLHAPEELGIVAEKIVTEMSLPFLIREKLAPVTASIGGAYHYGKSGDRETIMLRADEALYKAKIAGRNRYAIAA